VDGQSEMMDDDMSDSVVVEDEEEHEEVKMENDADNSVEDDRYVCVASMRILYCVMFVCTVYAPNLCVCAIGPFRKCTFICVYLIV